MSTQLNHYVIFGEVFPYDELKGSYDKLEAYMDSAFEPRRNLNNLCVLFDGMDGEYVVVGYAVEKTKNHQGFAAPIRIDPGEHPNAAAIRAEIKSLTGKDVEGRFIVVSHYR